MYRARLIHWNTGEAKERARSLRISGYVVDYREFSPNLLRESENPPNILIIDPSRLPSQGRDVAMALRSYKSTRTIPLVFADGDHEKVERVKAQIPYAIYANWGQFVEAWEMSSGILIKNLQRLGHA